MRKTKGFTLIELVIVIVLTSIVAGIVGALLSKGYDSYFNARPIAKLSGKANVAVDNLLREIKSAESISTISTTGITFTNQQGQSVVIDLSGTTLRRSESGGTAQPLCTNVTSLAFNYYDVNLATTAAPANVNFLTMSMTITEETIPYSIMAGTVIRKKL